MMKSGGTPDFYSEKLQKHAKVGHFENLSNFSSKIFAQFGKAS